MRGKLFTVLALVMTLVMLFAACGDSVTGGKESAGSEPTSASSESPSADSEPVDATGKTIVYWSMWEATEPQGIAIQEALDAYTAKTGVKVEVEFKGRTGIREGLQPALDAGTPIDLFDEDIDRVNGVWGDYLMDIEEMAKAVDYDSTAVASLMETARSLGGGTLKTIPYQPYLFAWFYNPEIFEAAGVTAPPKTWAEFMDACEKIKAAGYIPVTDDDAYICCLFGNHLARYIGEDGVVDVITSGKFAETPEVLKAAEDFEAMAQKGYFSPNIGSNIWPNGQNTEFALGQVGMYHNGSWLPNEIKNLAGEDFVWGCFNYPTVENGATGLDTASFSAQCFGINKNSQVSQETFDLIVWLTKGEYDLKLSQASLGIPADTTNSEWPAQMASVQAPMNEVSKRFSWACGAESNADLTPILKENVMKLCAGTITAQQFVEAMESASN